MCGWDSRQLPLSKGKILLLATASDKIADLMGKQPDPLKYFLHSESGISV